MRDLSDEQRALLARRLADFDSFFRERMPVLVDFIQRLQLPEPHFVLREADRYIAPVDAWMKNQSIDQDDRIWLLTRLGYFIGELLIQRYSGHWFVDEDPDSPYFAHYYPGN